MILKFFDIDNSLSECVFLNEQRPCERPLSLYHEYLWKIASDQREPELGLEKIAVDEEFQLAVLKFSQALGDRKA